MNAHALAVPSRRVDRNRVAAYSGAMFLHAVAAFVVLLPLTAIELPPRVEQPPDPMEVTDVVVLPTPILPAISDPPVIPVTPRVETPPVETPIDITEMVTDEPADLPPIALPTPDVTDLPDAGDFVAQPLSNVTLAWRLRTVPPYPRPAIKNRWTGVVMLRVLVDETGVPAEVQLSRSSGRKVLDDAALKHAWKWRFHPAMDRGMPVKAWGTVPVEFELPEY